MTKKQLILIPVIALLMFSCNTKPLETEYTADCKPVLIPDYSEITIPVNIAPLNFYTQEEGERFFLEIKGEDNIPVTVSSGSGKFNIPLKKWKKLLEKNINQSLNYTLYVKRDGKWFRYDTFKQNVAGYPTDNYVYYRLLHPGYESWTEISIIQRNLENFNERVVVENNAIDQNCVNCHSFNQNNSDDFMIHVRGSHGGTYFNEGGTLVNVDLNTEGNENGATYPRWHPSGKYVAYSSNKVVQQFHSVKQKKIEVLDLDSKLLLYDREQNELMEADVRNNGEYMDTYPEWSPDGHMLYFCRASQVGGEFDYQKIQYDLYSVGFDPKIRQFGEIEMVFNASETDKSVSHPRVSPNGKSLVFTLHNYGCFPIWHSEADLYSVSLENFEVEKLSVNSEFTESYHSWSSNGRWLLFSSKRGDGLSARPYMAFVSEAGEYGKPFVIPQKDPGFYQKFVKTFNLPEFSNSEISFTPGELKKAVSQKPVQAKWVN